MQTKSDDIIATLRNNLKKIINLYEGKKIEAERLNEENKQLKNQIALLEKQKNNLQEDNNNTELAKAFIDATGSNHNAKIKVNRIVREIDKCIALLNK